jgi:hypothetical protein
MMQNKHPAENLVVFIRTLRRNTTVYAAGHALRSLERFYARLLVHPAIYGLAIYGLAKYLHGEKESSSRPFGH